MDKAEEYKIRYKNTLTLLEERNVEIDKLKKEIEKYDSRIETLKKQQQENIKNYDMAIDALSGVDNSEIENKPEWLLLFEKIRLLKDKLTPKTPEYWTDIVTNIYNDIDQKIKKRDFYSIYLTNKQKEMIDNSLKRQKITIK